MYPPQTNVAPANGWLEDYIVSFEDGFQPCATLVSGHTNPQALNAMLFIPECPRRRVELLLMCHSLTFGHSGSHEVCGSMQWWQNRNHQSHVTSLHCLMFELTAEEKDHFGTAWTQSSYFALELSEVDSNSSSLEPWPSHGVATHSWSATPWQLFADLLCNLQRTTTYKVWNHLSRKDTAKPKRWQANHKRTFWRCATCNLPSNRLPFCPSKHLTAWGLAEVLTRTAPESQRFPDISRLLRLLHLSTRSVKTAMSYLVPRWRISWLANRFRNCA